MALPVLAGETDQVEAREIGFHQMGDGAGPGADLGDLVPPVGGEGGHRDQARFQCAIPGDDGVQPVADLEEYRPPRPQAEVVQAERELVSAPVEFPEGHATVPADHGVAS